MVVSLCKLCNLSCSIERIYSACWPTLWLCLSINVLYIMVISNVGWSLISSSFSCSSGKYVIFFFYPLDFTFVCPTEIIAFSDRADEFRKIGCEVIGCSIDSHFSHLAWWELLLAERKQWLELNYDLYAYMHCGADYSTCRQSFRKISFRPIIKFSWNTHQPINDIHIVSVCQKEEFISKSFHCLCFSHYFAVSKVLMMHLKYVSQQIKLMLSPQNADMFSFYHAIF